MTRTTSRLVDVAIGLALAGGLALFAVHLSSLAAGQVPQDPGYFGADADRVTQNLIDARSSYHRLNVHPMFGLVCAAFQRIFMGATDLVGPFRMLAGAIGAAYGAVLYSCLRTWDAGRLTAAAGTLLGAATAGFVLWVAIPEQHVLGGLSPLLVFILARRDVSDPLRRVLYSGVMFAIAYGMTVTDAAAWVFARTDWSGLPQGRPATFLRDNARRLPEHITAILIGLGIMAIGMAITWYALYNRLMGRLLDIFREVKYVTAEPVALTGGFHALGVLSPDAPGSLVVHAAVAVLLLWAIWRLRDGPVFIPLFGLFGVVLHSAYARQEAFLFSPEYAPAVAAGLVLALHRTVPRFAAPIVLLVAVGLGTANLAGYRQALAASHTLPLSHYGPVMPPPHELPPIPPGMLRL